MNISTKKDFNRIIVESEPFFVVVDFSRNLIERLQTYFLERGFIITKIDNQKLIVSRGNAVRNMIAFSMKKLRRDIIVELDDNDRITIVSKVDTTGQAIRKSEMDIFSLEVRDIIDFIQDKDSTQSSYMQNRKATIGNYAILIAIISIVILGLIVAFQFVR
mgnify:CR=1 FL=1